MNPDIEVIFLDHGNTLRFVVIDEEFSANARNELMRLVETKDSPDIFFAKLNERWTAYRKSSIECMVEASEKELWTIHLLPDYPTEKIAPLAGKLTRLWRDKDGRRIPPPETKEVIIELHNRGYTLGILANTITETEIPDWLAEEQLDQYFKTVVLSSVLKIKKQPWNARNSRMPGSGFHVFYVSRGFFYFCLRSPCKQPVADPFPQCSV